MFVVNPVVEPSFPGTEPVNEALVRYRGNFGRLLAYVHKGGQDFTEHMIRTGFSPYFNKYGNAQFHRDAYVDAERQAQSSVQRAVWNQVLVNGSEIRNYAALKTWWDLRASIIDDATIFTELREHSQVGGGSHSVVRIGSVQQPFQLFIPNAGDSLMESRVDEIKQYTEAPGGCTMSAT